MAVAAGLGVLTAPLGWWVTDVLERDNDFCNACHLEPGVPLHIAIREDFDGRPTKSLVAVHAAALVASRPPETAAFRCIDCHGGVGFLGRARVKILAAKDAFWFVAGHFEEPAAMAWPLLDADCSQCHPGFEPHDEAGEGGPVPFHALPVHNVALGVGCVECHLSHDPGGVEDLYHLQPTHVRRQCAQCHTEFE